MTIYLIVDAMTRKVRLVTKKPTNLPDGWPLGEKNRGRGTRLKPTEMAYAINVIIPGGWGRVQPFEINVPSPIEVGITSAPVVDARHG